MGHNSGKCLGCGADYDAWTRGCILCCNRHYHRAIRSGDKELIAEHYRIGNEHAVEGSFAGATVMAKKWCDGDYYFPFWTYR